LEVDIDDEALQSVPPTPPPPGYSFSAQSGPSELRVPELGPSPEIDVAASAGLELEALDAAHGRLPAVVESDLEADADVPAGRISDIPPEVAPEDFEVSDPIPRSPKAPPAPALKYSPDGAAVDPLSFSGAASAPPAVSDAAASGSADAFGPEPSTVTTRKRYWWEELFGDDFLRTMKPMTDAQLKAEAVFIEQRLALEKGALILDLACGTGRHAVELASRGYNVVGYDLSLAMLARAADEAQEHGQKINFLHGDMRELDFEEAFDAVICWTTSFGYFDDEKNFAVAQRIQRALRPGGLLLLDVVNRDFVAQMQPALAWFEGEGCVCMDEARLDFFSSRLKVKRTVMLDDGRSREIDYSMRVYSLHELGRLLHDAGFKVTEVTGRTATPGVFLGAESPRLIVLAEKP
jgi:SAM-dependent methyltransferase